MVMLRLVSIHKSYSSRGEKKIPVLSDLNLCINEGETLVLFGENGSGKSTLLNIIYGKDTDFLGEIFLNDKNISKKVFIQKSNNFLLLHQNRGTGLPETLTLLEVFALNKNKNSFFLNERKLSKELYNHLKRFDIGIENLINRQIKSLSGGEYQLFNMVLLLDRINNSDNSYIILLDEHTAHLDPLITNKVLKLTTELINKSNTTTIIVSHNIIQGLQFSNNIGILKNGQLFIVKKEKEINANHIHNLLESGNIEESVYNKNGGQHCI